MTPAAPSDERSRGNPPPWQKLWQPKKKSRRVTRDRTCAQWKWAWVDSNHRPHAYQAPDWRQPAPVSADFHGFPGLSADQRQPALVGVVTACVIAVTRAAIRSIGELLVLVDPQALNHHVAVIECENVSSTQPTNPTWDGQIGALLGNGVQVSIEE